MRPKDLKREVRSFGKLWKQSGHRIMVRLLEAYSGDVLGVSKACVVYSIQTDASLAEAKQVAREMGARI